MTYSMRASSRFAIVDGVLRTFAGMGVDIDRMAERLCVVIERNDYILDVARRLAALGRS
jgi:hypothetical protein